jgi:hypothetical protein
MGVEPSASGMMQTMCCSRLSNRNRGTGMGLRAFLGLGIHFVSALLIHKKYGDVVLSVGRNILQEIMRNGADGQNTDVRPQTPTKATYADIAKLPIRMSSLRVRGA